MRKTKKFDREQDTMQSEDSVLVQSVDLGSGQEAWRSLSCLTDSTEQSAPVNFDMSNRVSASSQRINDRTHLYLRIVVVTRDPQTGETPTRNRQDKAAH